MRKLVSFLSVILVCSTVSAQEFQKVDTTVCNIDSLKTTYIEILSDSLAVLLDISSKCENEYATRDYNHLSNCQTLMMEVNPSYKYRSQFDAYLEKYDFRPNSIEQAEDFWIQVVLRFRYA